MSNLKGIVCLTSLVGLGTLSVVACSDDGNLSNTSSSGGGTTTTQELSGQITTSRTLSKGNEYVLKGLVEVKAGAVLTIEKGTTIKGDSISKAILLVEAGAKIIAEGTADEPIVFTSAAAAGNRRAGDWGGLVILGKAPTNVPGGSGTVEGILKNGSGTTYGGTDPADNSGVLKYVRVEYAGTILSPDNEVNGITFAGVGSGTVVDYVQVRQALDDCFEWFGGTVNAKHLICQRNQDDGFDTDNGYSGKLQFLVLQQDPAHVGEDNGFESDNDAQGSPNEPFTSPTVFNATICGKNADPTGAQFGALLRRNTRGSYNNIIFTGFESSLDIRDKSTATAAQAGSTTFKGSIFFNAKATSVSNAIAYPETGSAAPDLDNDGAFDEVAWIQTEANNNKTVDPGIDCFNPKTPTFGPAASITAGAVTPPNDGFFDATATYVGAFRDANDKWATGKWVVWDEQ